MPTKRADGRWQEQVSVIEHGKKKQKYFYAKTKKELLQKIAAYEERVNQGPAFSSVADEYWEEASANLAPNSLRGYHPAYLRAKAFFTDTPITMIEPMDVRRFMDQYIKEYSPAKKTANTQRQMLRNIFTFAFDKGLVKTNPVDGQKIKKGLDQKPRSLPSDDDLRKVKANADNYFGMFAYWILYTGLRRGELLALTWDDVDFENNFIRVNKSLYYVNGQPKIKAPKTEKGTRLVPLMTALRNKLQPPPDGGIVFPDTKGGYITEMPFQKRWKTYCAKTGVTCTPHELRHAYATMLFDNAIDPKDAQDLLGHAQLSTTQDIYTHIRESRKLKTRDKLIDVDFDLE
jgi:integrase